MQLADAEKKPWEWYKSFVYEAGNIGTKKALERSQKPVTNLGNAISPGSAISHVTIHVTIHVTSPAISPVAMAAKEKCQELQLNGRLINRIRNLSEGIIAGTAKLIACLQEQLQRGPREPRELWDGSSFFTIRVFHQPRLV